MKGHLLFLTIFSLISLHFSGADESPQLNDDILGLLVFKSELHDPFYHLQSWNEDDNSPCSWRFIQCNPATGRVSSLTLDGLQFSGKIGRGLENLQHLKVLSLANNNFSGDISPNLGLIPSLQNLNLSHNRLSGRLPTVFLANMSSVRFLDLSENMFSGPVPDNMFDNCSSLRYLSLSGNLLEGPIPSTLAKCSVLNYLNLSNNHFSGNPTFSGGFWSLTRLRTLDLSRNQFSGPVPGGVSSIHNLKELHLGSNLFSGAIPADIGFCPHLISIDFSDNQFAGKLPDSIRGLNSLTHFDLSKNMLNGGFPQWISSMNSLQYLDFSGNGFNGVLPSSIGDLKSLNVINLRGNALNGSIPEGIFRLGLDQADFSKNQFTGSIPKASGEIFETLRALDLSGNKITGDIPAEMGLFSKLRYLNLSWNDLRSRMPPEIGYLQNLTVLDLRNSGLFGSIPGDVCDSGSLAVLQLDGNLLGGSIPEEIGNCSSLYLLSLSHNNLTGSIPKSMAMLKKLEILKMEFNHLTGEIPQELGTLQNLLAVNISYNSLTGRLPVAGIFQNLDITSIQGNLGLCSPLLKGPCKMNVPKPLVLDPFAHGNQIGNHEPEQGDFGDSRHRRLLSVSAIAAIVAAVLIVIGVATISLLNASARRRLAFVDHALESMCSSSSSRSGSLGKVGKLILFDSRSSPEWVSDPGAILNKGAEIGEGVFGTTYKATFAGTTVVIKKLLVQNTVQFQDDFDREIRILGKVRHPNLISMKGYYWTPQLKLLVMEYAKNGSLQSRLHERKALSPPLSWPERFKIMLGTAKGLAHLHDSFRPPIVHYGIKPGNILLDDNLNPKISDFGLARLVAHFDKHVAGNNRFHSAPGYAAPELACQSLRVNEKCDVYGFGVLVLELITGRRPVEYGEDNVVILSDHVRVLLEEGNVLECVDRSMGEFPEEEVLPAMKVALVCTSQVPSSRPSMAEVVHILQVIKTPAPQRMEAF